MLLSKWTNFTLTLDLVLGLVTLLPIIIRGMVWLVIYNSIPSLGEMKTLCSITAAWDDSNKQFLNIHAKFELISIELRFFFAIAIWVWLSVNLPRSPFMRRFHFDEFEAFSFMEEQLHKNGEDFPVHHLTTGLATRVTNTRSPVKWVRDI